MLVQSFPYVATFDPSKAVALTCSERAISVEDAGGHYLVFRCLQEPSGVAPTAWKRFQRQIIDAVTPYLEASTTSDLKALNYIAKISSQGINIYFENGDEFKRLAKSLTEDTTWASSFVETYFPRFIKYVGYNDASLHLLFAEYQARTLSRDEKLSYVTAVFGDPKQVITVDY